MSWQSGTHRRDVVARSPASHGVGDGDHRAALQTTVGRLRHNRGNRLHPIDPRHSCRQLTLYGTVPVLGKWRRDRETLLEREPRSCCRHGARRAHE